MVSSETGKAYGEEDKGQPRQKPGKFSGLMVREHVQKWGKTGKQRREHRSLGGWEGNWETKETKTHTQENAS